MKRKFLWVGVIALVAAGCSALRDRQDDQQTPAHKMPGFLRGFEDEYNSMKQRTSSMGMPSRPMTAEDMLKDH